MYLRETRRTNKDGSVVRYLQLAHNTRNPKTGASTAKVVHNFGRAELVDREALARLVTSISRLLEPEQQAALSPEGTAAAGGPEAVAALDTRGMAGAGTLDPAWAGRG